MNREHFGSFRNKSGESSFKWVPRYILFLAKLKGKGRIFFLEGTRIGAALWDYPEEHLVFIRDEKVCRFVKLTMIPPFLCFLLERFANNYYRELCSIINLCIDSRICQKNPLVTRGRPYNHFDLSRENVVPNMMLVSLYGSTKFSN